MVLLGSHIAVELIFWGVGGITSIMFLSFNIEYTNYKADSYNYNLPTSLYPQQYASLAFASLLTLSISGYILFVSLS